MRTELTVDIAIEIGRLRERVWTSCTCTRRNAFRE